MTGVERRGRPQKYSPELKAIAIGLLRDGLNITKVAYKLGVPRATIRWWFNEDTYGVARPSKPRIVLQKRPLESDLRLPVGAVIKTRMD